MSQLKVNTIRHTGASSDAVTLASDGTCIVKATNNLSNRNVVVNGDFSVDQRNSGSSVDLDAGGTSAYAADRFVFFNYGSGELDTDVQRLNNDAPEGFKYCNKLTVTTPESSGGTPAADDRLSMQYRAEANTTDHFDFGQSTAKTFYISFWVKSSLTGNFGLALIGGGKNYCVLYPISAANTWEKIEIKVPGPTSGSWLQGTNASIELKFGLYSGSNRVGPDQGITGTGSWQSGDSPQGTTGQVQLGGTNGATWFITGLQMEVSDYGATDFEHRSYADELRRCQRYFQQIGATGQDGTYTVNAAYLYDNGNKVATGYNPPVPFRATPTMTNGSTYLTVRSASTSTDVNSYNFIEVVAPSTWISISGVLHTDAGNDGDLAVWTCPSNGLVQMSAEL